VLNPPAPLAALTIQMAPGIDRWEVEISSRQRVDLLTIIGSGGQLVDWLPNELPQDGTIGLLFVAPLVRWVRS
jgi:hypothetical protein